MSSFFFWTGANFKQISSTYHILSFCSLHQERARRRENKKEKEKEKETKEKSVLGVDLKTTPHGRSPCLKDTGPQYQIFTKKLYPITVHRGGVLGKKRSLKMIQKHLCGSTLELSLSLPLSLSGLWMLMWRERKTLPFFPTCPQFSWVIIWASIESFSVTDARCNSFNALGSWESICICMIRLHNK